MTTLLLCILAAEIPIFYFLTAKKLNKMADVNVTIEAYVARINAAVTKIGSTLTTVQSELNALPGGNPLTEQTGADLDASVAALEALANEPTPTAPEATEPAQA